MRHWTTSDIPPQGGRVAVVTGTGGLGFEAALALAHADADVIIAGRDPGRGAAAVERIRRNVAGARVRFMALDLASLGSVADFSARLRRALPCVDVLVNNAAVMAPPTRRETVDGFEQQFGTNHLGHFALTGQLVPLLRRSGQARVVSLSSIAARRGVIDFDNLHAEQHYQPMQAYSQSKLACLLFALELQRRSGAGGWGIQSIAVHPGIARTELLPNGAGARSGPGMARRVLWFLFQPAAQGALPTLFAATSPQARGGMYYGPDSLGETRGHPAIAQLPPQALDTEQAEHLWRVSERLTRVVFPVPGAEEAARPVPVSEALAH